MTYRLMSLTHEKYWVATKISIQNKALEIIQNSEMNTFDSLSLGLINTMKHLSKNKLPSPATFERIVYKNPSEYHYMKVQLEFQDHGFRLTDAQFKQLIVLALRDLFGEVGAALPFDVLTYEEKTLSAILRICSSGLVKLWSSLTLLGSYQNKKCAFRVMQVSPFLLALSGNSREFILEE
ncbi:ribonuclease P protein subunit p14 isoform X2 [Phascolarctos cinereus]